MVLFLLPKRTPLSSETVLVKTKIQNVVGERLSESKDCIPTLSFFTRKHGRPQYVNKGEDTGSLISSRKKR